MENTCGTPTYGVFGSFLRISGFPYDPVTSRQLSARSLTSRSLINCFHCLISGSDGTCRQGILPGLRIIMPWVSMKPPEYPWAILFVKSRLSKRQGTQRHPSTPAFCMLQEKVPAALKNTTSGWDAPVTGRRYCSFCRFAFYRANRTLETKTVSEPGDGFVNEALSAAYFIIPAASTEALLNPDFGDAEWINNMGFETREAILHTYAKPRSFF